MTPLPRAMPQPGTRSPAGLAAGRGRQAARRPPRRQEGPTTRVASFDHLVEFDDILGAMAQPVVSKVRQPGGHVRCWPKADIQRRCLLDAEIALPQVALG